MSKSVSTTLDDKDHEALKALAKGEDRDISGQMRHMLRWWLRDAREQAAGRPPIADGRDSTLGEHERAFVADPPGVKEPLPG